MVYNGHGFGVTAAQPPLEGPFGGALKKVYVAVGHAPVQSHGQKIDNFEGGWTKNR